MLDVHIVSCMAMCVLGWVLSPDIGTSRIVTLIKTTVWICCSWAVVVVSFSCFFFCPEYTLMSDMMYFHYSHRK